MLTIGIDTLTGTAGNDTFNAPVSDGGTPTQTLGGLDSIDGGAGTDTLKVDFGSAAAVLPATATIKNIEILDVATSNTAAASNIDVSNIAGVQTVTLANGGDQNSTVKGGENVTVSGGAIANVSGISLKSVTINKVAGDNAVAADIVISNDTAAAVGTGATLTSVVLNDIASTAAVATVAGNAVSEITVQNQKSALATTITNAVSTALKVNVDNAGYNAAGTAVAGVVVTAGAKAEAITVNATGSKSNVTVNAAAAKTLSLTGSADLALAGVSGAALTSIDGTAATGGLDLGVLNAGTATVKTGSGADKFEIKATKVTVDAGAGNDIVTIGSAIAAGSTINLGAGDDVLQFATGGSVAANTTTATTTIDAGDGIDSLAAVLVNATNAKQFVNFERIDATTGNVTLDVDLMTGSTIGGVTLNGGSGTNTIQNLAVGAGLAVAGANTGSLVIGVKGAATNTADTFGITFAGKAGSSATAASPDAVSATKIGLQGVEAVTVASGGTGFVANTLSLTQNTELKTVTITGDKALSLTLAGQTGADVNFGGTTTGKGVSSFDGSAASGKLTLDLSNVVVTADTGGTVDDVILNIASGGLTIKGGSADDTIKVGAFSSTVTGGAGKDAFFVEKAVVLTGATAAASAVKTTITDFAAGDTIDLTADTSVSTTLNKVTLTAGVQNLDDALDLVGATTKTVSWFNYGSDTYVVYNADATTGLDAGDVLVKLTGTIDLSNATVDGNGVLALA